MATECIKDEEESSAFQIQHDVMRDIRNLCDKYYSRYHWLREHESALRRIAQSALQPFSVAVCGYMNKGKSSLINALIGRSLALTGTTETTATINMIVDDPARLDSFIVHWNSQPPEELPLGELARWAGHKDIEDLVRRTRYLTLHARSEPLRKAHAQIIDTPGFDSLVEAHQKVIDDFFAAETPMAQAMILVVGTDYQGSAQSVTKKFRQNCPPGSGPYNTVAVVHKWDEQVVTAYLKGIDGEEVVRGHVEAWQGFLAGDVAEVIPVSAPLALLAQTAPDTWFEGMMALLERMDEKSLKASLKYDQDWYQDAERSQFWNADSDRELPWRCFSLAAIHLFLRHPQTVAEARDLLRELGGLDRLKNFLEMRFFRRAAYIRRNSMSMQVRHVIDQTTRLIDQRKREMQRESRHWAALQGCVPPGGDLDAWVREHSTRVVDEEQNLQELLVSIDRFKRTVEHFWDEDLVSTRELSELSKWFALSEEEEKIIERVRSLREQEGRVLLDAEPWDAVTLVGCYQKIACHRNDDPDRDRERAAIFLTDRLLSVCDQLYSSNN